MSLIRISTQASAILSIIAFALYFLAIKRSKLKPNPTAWFIWTVVSIEVAIANSAAWGEKEIVRTSVMLIVYAICNAIIFVTSLLVKDKSSSTSKDKYFLSLAFVGGIAWFSFPSPVITLILGLFVHACGSTNVVSKIWGGQPEEPLPWVAFALASISNCLCIGDFSSWTLVKSLTPCYFLISNCIILVSNIVVYRRLQSPAGRNLI